MTVVTAVWQAPERSSIEKDANSRATKLIDSIARSRKDDICQLLCLEEMFSGQSP